MTSLSRRGFLNAASAAAVAIPALRARRAGAQEKTGLLAPDPAGMLDLPDGFTYRVISREAEPMDDGLFTPGDFDGMAAFPVEGDPRRCVLLRNHELSPGDDIKGAFGLDFAGARRLDAAKVYDWMAEGRPHLGGVSKLVVNLDTLTVERRFMALAGTSTNCAGGPTPWGSWLTCEETEENPGPTAAKPHGFVFEVPSAADGLVEAVPLRAMGRFRHEATVVDPATGVVYLTEDQGDGLFYRFLPATPGELARGGVLQALAIKGQPMADTRNWDPAVAGFPAAGELEVEWIALTDVEAPDADLRLRGLQNGAAIFARGEGMAFAIEADGPAIYFTCTSGGPVQLGQIFKYRPSPREGTSDEAGAPGRLSLFIESASADEFDMCDNIVAAPWGDVVLCEDGDGDNLVRGVRPDGAVYPIARNAHVLHNELCGACFAPDGRTLFVNVQDPGATFAIRGPWETLRGA